MKQERADRVADAMRAELGQMLQHEIKDPRIGFVSITRVEVSRDLGKAKVWVSILEDSAAADSAVQDTLAGLASAAGYLRGEVGRRLQLRHAPALEFRRDETISDSLHVQRLLREANKGSREEPQR